MTSNKSEVHVGSDPGDEKNVAGFYPQVGGHLTLPGSFTCIEKIVMIFNNLNWETADNLKWYTLENQHGTQ